MIAIAGITCLAILLGTYFFIYNMKQNKPERRPRLRTLKIGLLMAAVGLALMFASGLALMITIPIIVPGGVDEFEELPILVLLLIMIFISLLLFLVGIALIIYYYSARDKGVSAKEEKISESQTKE